MIPDGFEQADFAVPNRLSGSEIETQCKSRHTASLAEASGICSDAVGWAADGLSFPASPTASAIPMRLDAKSKQGTIAAITPRLTKFETERRRSCL